MEKNFIEVPDEESGKRLLNLAFVQSVAPDGDGCLVEEVRFVHNPMLGDGLACKTHRLDCPYERMRILLAASLS